MKKTAAIMLSITVVAVGIMLSAIFSLGSSQDPLAAPLSLIGISESSNNSTTQAIQIPDTAKFELFSFASAGATRTFTGKIISTQTGNGLALDVAIICDGETVGSATSDNTGNFKIPVKRDDCISGKSAHAEATYNDELYKSENVFMPDRPTFGRKAPESLRQNSISSQLSETSEVPEFSTLALGTATMISLLGVLYLRRQ